MAFPVKFTKPAQKTYDSLKPHLKDAVNQKTALLGVDPETLTKIFTHGQRYMDGTCLSNGKLCFVRLYFHYTPGSEVIWITSIADAIEISGMH